MSAEPVTAKPIIRWVGGKTQLLPHLVPLATAHPIRHYVEPFAGGAALFFKLASMSPRPFQRATIGDINPELVAMYRALRDDVDGLVKLLRGYTYDADEYRRMGKLETCRLSDTERGARLIFLMKTGFNGLYRVNRQGQYNVAFGSFKTPPTICDEPALRAASAALQGVEITHGSFGALVREVGPGDLVYFDPPYLPASDTANFTAYAREGFGPEDQERLATLACGMRARVMLSNADSPEARSLYQGLTIHGVSARRAVNCDAKKRGPVGEIIVTNWDDRGEARPVKRAPRAGAQVGFGWSKSEVA